MSSELAEKSVLGTMLNENHFIRDGGVETVFFEKQIHRAIFHAMNELASNSRAVDYITLLSVREPAELGGANYLAELRNFANPVRFDEYRNIMADSWRESEKKRLLQLAASEDWKIAEILQSFDDLQEEKTIAAGTSLQADLLEQYERPFNPEEDRTGTVSGLHDLDQLLNGFQDDEFIVVAARPSMGKTDVMNHFARSAGHAGHLPIIFSLEMSRKTILDRLIASAAGYRRLKMRNPYKYLTDEQKKRWTAVMNELDRANIHIDDRSGLRMSEIKATARKIIRSHPGKRPIIFIDYLQIIRPEGRHDNQTHAIGQISSELKQMAKTFHCPVVVLSQLSRGVESRPDKRPFLSDLRDSGNIEQDADVIAFLYREDYYDKTKGNANRLEIDVAKQRNGPIGRITVRYRKETGQLADIDWNRQAGEQLDEHVRR